MGRSAIIIAGAALLAAALGGCIVPAADDADDEASLAETSDTDDGASVADTSTVENVAQRAGPRADRALGPQQEVKPVAPSLVDGAPCGQGEQCTGRALVLPGMPVEGPGPEAAR